MIQQIAREQRKEKRIKRLVLNYKKSQSKLKKMHHKYPVARILKKVPGTILSFLEVTHQMAPLFQIQKAGTDPIANLKLKQNNQKSFCQLIMIQL